MKRTKYHLQDREELLVQPYIQSQQGSKSITQYRSVNSRNNNKNIKSLKSELQEIQEPFYLKLSNHSKSQANIRNNQNPQSNDKSELKDYLLQVYHKSTPSKQKEHSKHLKTKLIDQKDSLSTLQSHVIFQKKLQDRIQERYKQTIQTQINERKVRIQAVRTQQSKQKNKATPQLNLNRKMQSYKQFFESAIAQKQKIYSNYSKYMEEEQVYQKRINKQKLLNLQGNSLSKKHNAQSSYGLDQLIKRQYRQSLERQTLEKSRISNLKRQDLANGPFNKKRDSFMTRLTQQGRHDLQKYNILNKLSN